MENNKKIYFEKKYDYLKISNKYWFFYFFLNFLSLSSIYIFININLNYLGSLNLNYYLILFLAFFIINVSTIFLILIFDLEKFIFFNILNIILIYLSLSKLFILNQYLLSILFFYIILQIFLYFKIEKIYNNNILIDWLEIFRQSWKYFSMIYFIFLFVFMVFLPSIENIKAEHLNKILDNIANFNNPKFINIRFDYINRKIEEVIYENLDKSLPEQLKRKTIYETINDLNKKFSINIKPENTIKEAIVKYIINQTTYLSTLGFKAYLIKTIIFLTIFLIIQPIFYITGIIFSNIFYFLSRTLIKLSFFKIEYKNITKEEIEL
jgi:hypothetical protein